MLEPKDTNPYAAPLAAVKDQAIVIAPPRTVILGGRWLVVAGLACLLVVFLDHRLNAGLPYDQAQWIVGGVVPAGLMAASWIMQSWYARRGSNFARWTLLLLELSWALLTWDVATRAVPAVLLSSYFLHHFVNLVALWFQFAPASNKWFRELAEAQRG